MSETLRAALGSGLEIETKTESELLLNFIKNSWPTTTPIQYPDLPIKSKIDWGAVIDRTTKTVIVRTYTVFSNILDVDIGAQVIGYNCPVAIDVYVRDIEAQAERREPTKMIAIETYLRDYLSTNRLGLRSKGIHSIGIDEITHIQEPSDDEQDQVWFHLVVQCRMFWHMVRTPV